MPVWFPFAIGASLVTMILSGSRSGWKLPADQPKPSPAPPQLPQSTVQGELRLAEEGSWPFRYLPPLVTVRGRRFVKGQPLRARGVEPHAIYDEVGGKRRVVVLPTGRFVVVA